MKKEETKSFKDLIHEVQEKGICGQCGGCVSFCTTDGLNALVLGSDGYPRLIDEEKCLKCGICYLICPQIDVLNDELSKRFTWAPPIGTYLMMASTQTTSSKIKQVCTDGGVVTSLLTYAFDRRIIDGAIVSRKSGPFMCKPVLVTRPEDLVETAGSHFDGSQHLDEIGKRYTTFSPTIQEIKDISNRGLSSIAVVGTPCQIHTIRKMQLLHIIPADKIVLTIGLFCMENFSFDNQARKRLEQRFKITFDNVIKLNIKDDVIITLDSGKTIQIPFEIVDEIARPACFACTDFANDYADISAGGLGSPDGYTTTVIRTSLGERIYNGAKQKRYIKELNFKSNEDRILHKTEMMAKIVSFINRKKVRARENVA